MYDFLDRPVASLDHGGQFTVWAMRSWAKAIKDRRCPCATLAPTFQKWKVDAALPHFVMSMALLNRHALEPISIAPVECRRVREGEAAVLALIGSTGHGDVTRMDETIALLVDPESVLPLSRAMTEVAHSLAEAGMTPSAPCPQNGGVL
jgi:hypothetical protein